MIVTRAHSISFLFVLVLLMATFLNSASAIPVIAQIQDDTEPSDEIAGQVLVDGQPAMNAFVYIFDLGTALTDEQGQFVVRGAIPDLFYQAYVQKTGTLLPTTQFSLTAGSYTTVNGSSFDYNPRGCGARDITPELQLAADKARDLRERALADIALLDPSTRLRQENGRMISAEALGVRIGQQFNNYLRASRALPEILLDCSAISSCRAVSIARVKAAMAEQLNNLRRESLLANRGLRRQGQSSVFGSLLRASMIKTTNIRAKRHLRRFASVNYRCD